MKHLIGSKASRLIAFLLTAVILLCAVPSSTAADAPRFWYNDAQDARLKALDCLMTAAGLDDTHVWDFRDAREKLREFLAGSDPEAAGNWGGVRAFSGREEAVRYFLKQVKGAEDESTAGAAGAYLEVRFPFAAALADFWKNVVM